MNFYTHGNNGIQVAIDCNRVVSGLRGPYIEFDKKHIIMDALYIPDDLLWRVNPRGQFKNIKYVEWYSLDDRCMFYEQLSTVNYADYKIGCFYASPKELQWKGVVKMHTTPKPGLIISTEEVGCEYFIDWD